MFKLGDNKILRNLEEQVQYLTDYHKVNQGIAQWGIRVVGQVETESELPDPLTYDGEYGDTYAVGTEAPFNFYIWTRASIVGDPGYWFPFGEISIVGPQGPKGDKGDKGADGQSSKWYVFGESPIGKTGYNDGDMGIVMSPTSTSFGNVYHYTKLSETVGNWIAQGSIRGPQGIQGPIGPVGLQGEQGPQGPKGETGDVGGFINIIGTLSNTNQLPLPSSLDNLTYAYLVFHSGGSDQANDHYDLYIQVGETSDDSVWFNAGPFNAATLITVNGKGQNVWDADTKLDKYTRITDYNQVYAKAADGSQGHLNVTKQTVADSVVQRQSDGNILLPETPAESADAISKGYADNTYLKIPTNSIPGTSQAVIGVGSDGKTTQRWIANPAYIFSAAANNSVIPMYREVGKAIINADTAPANTIYVAQPQLDYEAANKKYVDDAISALRAELQG